LENTKKLAPFIEPLTILTGFFKSNYTNLLHPSDNKMQKNTDI